jgi:hypothetical protein
MAHEELSERLSVACGVVHVYISHSHLHSRLVRKGQQRHSVVKEEETNDAEVFEEIIVEKARSPKAPKSPVLPPPGSSTPPVFLNARPSTYLRVMIPPRGFLLLLLLLLLLFLFSFSFLCCSHHYHNRQRSHPFQPLRHRFRHRPPSLPQIQQPPLAHHQQLPPW